MSDVLRKMMSSTLNVEEFRLLALKEGMETLKEDAILKSMQGLVNYRDAIAITDEPLDRILLQLKRNAASKDRAEPKELQEVRPSSPEQNESAMEKLEEIMHNLGV
jgi:hypothetical protein